MSLAVAMALTACQQPGADKETVDDLRTRVQALEQGQQEIVAEMRDKAAKQAVVAAKASLPLVGEDRYELVGLRERRTYPNRVRCEAALNALQESRDAQNASLTGGGRIIFASISCIPM